MQTARSAQALSPKGVQAPLTKEQAQGLEYLLRTNGQKSWADVDDYFVRFRLGSLKAFIISNDSANGERTNKGELARLRRIHPDEFSKAVSIEMRSGKQFSAKKESIVDVLGLKRPGILVYSERDKGDAYRLLISLLSVKWGGAPDPYKKRYLTRWLTSNGFYSHDEIEAKRNRTYKAPSCRH
ncbi:MAG: hypothetical protein KGH58_04215 [Candidatus Micrarchaeota archaeon]|nr:hypothetical protein [Candidatus Micrarchaeota archaeon]